MSKKIACQDEVLFISLLTQVNLIQDLVWVSLRGVVANILDCNIEVSLNSNHAIVLTFKLMPIEKA